MPDESKQPKNNKKLKKEKNDSDGEDYFWLKYSYILRMIKTTYKYQFKKSQIWGEC